MSTNNFEIRLATEVDFPSIQSVVQEVWPVAYRDVITAEQIDYMLRMMYDDASLRRQMTKEGCTFLLAENKSGILGFASYSEDKSGQFKLHKLYVGVQQQGTGAGRALLNEVCNRSIELGGKSLELQVNKKNTKAIDFYLKNGFSIDHEAVFDIGNGFVMDDYIMLRHL